MKEWFYNLEDNKKKWVHIVLIGLWFLLPLSAPENGNNTILSLLWFIINPLEFLFIIYHVQYNKEKKTTTTTDNSTYQKTTSNLANNVKIEENNIKIRSNIECDEFICVEDEEYIIKYSCYENLCFCSNFDSFELTDAVNFKLETDNQYDSNTVAVFVKDKKIGLMYEGTSREIVANCLKRSKYEIRGYVNYRDKENQKIGITLGFYSNLADRESFTTSIIKTSKKDELTDEKRYDVLELMYEGDIVELEESYDIDGLLVIDACGNELGEISESAAKKVEKFGGVDNVVARICEINDEDYEKKKFKIRIYCKGYSCEDEMGNQAKPAIKTNKVIPINNKNYIDQFKGQSITFIDLETPNLNNNSICQIGIINYTDGNLTYKENLLINPEAKFDNKNMQIHGITPMMVEKAPTFAKVWPNISQYFINSIIVGHGVHFDINVIDKTLANYGLKLNSLSYIDTQKVAQHNIQSDKYTLSALCDKLGIDTQKAHDALSDCKDCMNLLIKLMEKYSINLTQEKEEYFPKNVVSENKSYVNINYSKESMSYQYVQNLLNKILEDETVDELELKTFVSSVEKLNLKETFPISKAYEIAIRKLNGDTTLDVKQAMETVTGNIKSNGFDGVFEGKIFCLTGDFNHGSKNDVKAYLESKGAIVSETINMKVNYLVRGSQGSDAYAYGNYGGKVKRAMEMQEKGKDVRIINEEDIY